MIRGPLRDRYSEILTPQAAGFVVELARPLRTATP